MHFPLGTDGEKSANTVAFCEKGIEDSDSIKRAAVLARAKVEMSPTIFKIVLFL